MSAVVAALEQLRERLRFELGIGTALWDGPWGALKDAGRLSVAMPVALVSLNALTVSLRARRRFEPGQLRAATAGDPADEFPAPGQRKAGDPDPRSPAPAPHARIEIGVTLLASDPDSIDRAVRVASLAEVALPVLVGFALEDIRGTSLYSAAFARTGLAGFLLAGSRDVEPDIVEPARAALRAVDAVFEPDAPERVYVRGAP